MVPSDGGQHDGIKQFTLWALSVLNLKCEHDGSRFYTLYPPGGDRSAFNGVSRLQFTFEENVNHHAVEHLTADSSLFRWIVRRLRSLGNTSQLTPLHQPAGASEIVAGLLPRYSMDRGKVRVNGCQIESRPLLRLTSIQSKPDQPKHLVTTYHDRDGAEVTHELVRNLGLDVTSPKAKWNSRFADEEVDAWKQQSAASIGGEPEDVVAAAMIWCNFATGEITFTCQGQQTSIAFSDWATLLVDPSYTTPPFECEESGGSGYRVTLTSDGKFTLADAVETCPVSGARLLSSNLGRCELTGQRVARTLLTQCPVTGAYIQQSKLETCRATGLKVNPACLRFGCSTAASSPAPIDHQDARLSILLQNYPELGRYSGWRLCETITRNVFVAGRIKQILLVVEPESSKIEHAATGNRLLSRWQSTSVSEFTAAAGTSSTPQADG